MSAANPQAFFECDIRVATILEAVLFERAKKPAYKLRLDCGSAGILQSSAQLTECYAAHDLVGRKVLTVVNFPEKNIAGFISQCLVLGVYADGGVRLVSPDDGCKNGDRLG